MRDPIKMNIPSTRHLGHRRLVRGSGEDDSRNLFTSYFIQKDENLLPRRRRSKYNVSQESQNANPEYSDSSTGEVTKLYTRERRTDTCRDGRGG